MFRSVFQFVLYLFLVDVSPQGQFIFPYIYFICIIHYTINTVYYTRAYYCQNFIEVYLIIGEISVQLDLIFYSFKILCELN